MNINQITKPHTNNTKVNTRIQKHQQQYIKRIIHTSKNRDLFYEIKITHLSNNNVIIKHKLKWNNTKNIKEIQFNIVYDNIDIIEDCINVCNSINSQNQEECIMDCLWNETNTQNYSNN